MEKSSKHLVECCLLDLLPTNISTLVDYFGIDNVTDKEIFMIIFGIYQGLIKFKGVSENLLHKCCLSGRLNELIHKNFKFMPTRYYEKFCNKKLKLIHYIQTRCILKFTMMITAQNVMLKGL